MKKSIKINVSLNVNYPRCNTSKSDTLMSIESQPSTDISSDISTTDHLNKVFPKAEGSFDTIHVDSLESRGSISSNRTSECLPSSEIAIKNITTKEKRN